MAYGTATGNYNPQIQSAGNKPAALTRTNSTSGAIQPQSGQVQQMTSPTGSAVSPTGQISQTPMQPVPQQAAANPTNSTYYNYQGTPLMGTMQNAILQALQQPLWGPEQIAQMKGAQKDSTALMTQQLSGQIDQRAAARGTLGSGQNEATQRRLQQGMASDLLGRYRDIDISSVEQNRNALMGMLGMGMNFSGMDEGFKQAAVGTALGNKDMDIRKLLGLEGISAQREGNRMNMAGSLIGSLLGYQSGLDQLGYNYTALDAAQQNALLDRLLRGF